MQLHFCLKNDQVLCILVFYNDVCDDINTIKCEKEKRRRNISYSTMEPVLEYGTAAITISFPLPESLRRINILRHKRNVNRSLSTNRPIFNFNELFGDWQFMHNASKTFIRLAILTELVTNVLKIIKPKPICRIQGFTSVPKRRWVIKIQSCFISHCYTYPIDPPLPLTGKL